MPPEKLPYGPVAVHMRRNGILVAIDKTQTDSAVPPELARIGSAILGGLTRVDLRPHPAMEIRIRRVPSMSPDAPVYCDLTDLSRPVLDIHVLRGLITEEIALHLGVAHTGVMRHYTR